MLADAYAGINAFGAGATKFSEAVQTFLRDNHMSREATQENGTEQPTGPPRQAGTLQEAIEQQWDQSRVTEENGNYFVDATDEMKYSLDEEELELVGERRHKPTSSREWHAFNRSFANQTMDMIPDGNSEGIGGESDDARSKTKELMIFTDSHVFLVEAKGYMRGFAEDRIRITNTNKKFIEAVRRRIYGTHYYAETIDRWAEIVQNERERNRGDNAVFGDGKPAEQNAGLLAAKQNSDSSGDTSAAEDDSWDYEVDEYSSGALIYDGKGGAFRVKEHGIFEPLDLDGESETDAENAGTVEDANGEGDGAYIEMMSLDDEVRYSLDEDTELADRAIDKNEALGFVDSSVMDDAVAMRERTLLTVGE